MNDVHSTVVVFIRLLMVTAKIGIGLFLFLAVFFGLATIPAPMMAVFFVLLLGTHLIQHRLF